MRLLPLAALLTACGAPAPIQADWQQAAAPQPAQPGQGVEIVDSPGQDRLSDASAPEPSAQVVPAGGASGGQPAASYVAQPWGGFGGDTSSSGGNAGGGSGDVAQGGAGGSPEVTQPDAGSASGGSGGSGGATGACYPDAPMAMACGDLECSGGPCTTCREEGFGVHDVREAFAFGSQPATPCQPELYAGEVPIMRATLLHGCLKASSPFGWRFRSRTSDERTSPPTITKAEAPDCIVVRAPIGSQSATALIEVHADDSDLPGWVEFEARLDCQLSCP